MKCLMCDETKTKQTNDGWHMCGTHFYDVQDCKNCGTELGKLGEVKPDQDGKCNACREQT